MTDTELGNETGTRATRGKAKAKLDDNMKTMFGRLMIQEGLTPAQVARVASISSRTAERIKAAYQANDGLVSTKRSTGRHRKGSPDDRQALLNICFSTPSLSIREAVEQLYQARQVRISTRTGQRWLHESGWARQK